MAFASISPKTEPMPNPLLRIDDPEQIRNIAFEMEDAIGGDGDFILERPGIIFMSRALHALADRIERDG